MKDLGWKKRSNRLAPRGENLTESVLSDDGEPCVWLEKPDGFCVPLEGNLSIGRAPQSGLQLYDEAVSRRHAMVHAQGKSEFWLVDLGSRNGSYVNAQRVHQAVKLRDGDELRIGGDLLVFRNPTVRSSTTVVGGAPTRSRIEATPCWLLVADVVDSNGLAQALPGKEFAKLMDEWFEQSRVVVEKNAGTINKYLGDGFFAFWRASGECVEGLIPTLEALRELRETQEFQYRYVLHHGRVWMGGVASCGEESLFGPNVNFVFREEKLAAKLGQLCLFSEPAAFPLHTRLDLEYEGTHELDGIKGEHRFFVPAA